MTTHDPSSHALGTRPPPEQLRYARALWLCTWVGVAWLVAAFVAYAAGAPARVPLQRLPGVWGLPLQHYLAATASPTGWHWLADWPQADAAMLIGIALLAAAPALCVLAVLPMYLQRGDRAYVLICVITLVVALLAASGALGARH